MGLSVKQNVLLKSYNTLALEGYAERFVAVQSREEVRQAIKLARQQGWPLTVLGGGSNVIVSSQINGLVVKVELEGVELIRQQGSDVTIRVGAGENWHQLVMMTLENGWFGLENLSLIPGTVGAAPVQNIGAYGVELSDVLTAVEYLDLEEGLLHKLSAEECQFGYRDSIFKGALKGGALITAVELTLSTNPSLRLEYPSLKQQLSHLDKTELTPQKVSDAVCKIRQSKLPDPDVTPNAGSFFKNPIVSSEMARSIRERYSELVVFPAAEKGMLKLAAGWLIEQAGWKGCVEGEVGVHDKQALVLVNHGSANGETLLEFAAKIVQSVDEKFGVKLQMEPRVLS